MRWITASLLTKLVRGPPGSQKARRRKRPARRPPASVRPASEWQMEPREAPSDALGGLLVACVGLLPYDPVAGLAALEADPGPVADLPSATPSREAAGSAAGTEGMLAEGGPGRLSDSADSGSSTPQAAGDASVPGGSMSVGDQFGSGSAAPGEDFAAGLMNFWDPFAAAPKGAGAGARADGGLPGGGGGGGTAAGAGAAPALASGSSLSAAPGLNVAATGFSGVSMLPAGAALAAGTSQIVPPGHSTSAPVSTSAAGALHAASTTRLVTPSADVATASASSLTTATPAVLSPSSGSLSVKGVTLQDQTEGLSAGPGIVATFSDSDGNTSASAYTASINWGDKQTSTGSITGGGTNSSYAVQAGHRYAEEGNYTITITITDTDGAQATGQSFVHVKDAALSRSSGGTTLKATVGTPFSGTLVTFTDADSGGVASDYTALINWGDGSGATP